MESLISLISMVLRYRVSRHQIAFFLLVYRMLCCIYLKTYQLPTADGSNWFHHLHAHRESKRMPRITSHVSGPGIYNPRCPSFTCHECRPKSPCRTRKALNLNTPRAFWYIVGSNNSFTVQTRNKCASKFAYRGTISIFRQCYAFVAAIGWLR